jgi:hypothetical protein
MSQAEIKAFLSDIDKDKSGEVEIDEFVSLMSLMYQQGTTPGSTGLDLGHTMALFRRKHLLGALMAGGQQRTRLIETHDHMARLAVEEKGRDVRKGKNKFIYAVQRVQRKGMKEVAAASIAAEEKRGGWGRSYRVEKAQNAFFDAAQEFAHEEYEAAQAALPLTSFAAVVAAATAPPRTTPTTPTTTPPTPTTAAAVATTASVLADPLRAICAFPNVSEAQDQAADAWTQRPDLRPLISRSTLLGSSTARISNPDRRLWSSRSTVIRSSTTEILSPDQRPLDSRSTHMRSSTSEIPSPDQRPLDSRSALLLSQTSGILSPDQSPFSSRLTRMRSSKSGISCSDPLLPSPKGQWSFRSTLSISTARTPFLDDEPLDQRLLDSRSTLPCSPSARIPSLDQRPWYSRSKLTGSSSPRVQKSWNQRFTTTD